MEVKAKSEHLLTLKGNLSRSSKNYIAFQYLDPDRTQKSYDVRRTSS